MTPHKVHILLHSLLSQLRAGGRPISLSLPAGVGCEGSCLQPPREVRETSPLWSVYLLSFGVYRVPNSLGLDSVEGECFLLLIPRNVGLTSSIFPIFCEKKNGHTLVVFLRISEEENRSGSTLVFPLCCLCRVVHTSDASSMYERMTVAWHPPRCCLRLSRL